MSAVVAFDQALIRAAERVMPVNIEAEQEILGALLLRPDALSVVQSILLPEHFGERLHSEIYRAVLATVESQQRPSIATVRQRLGAADLGGVTLQEYLARLMAEAPSAVGVAATARMVRDLWALRQIAAVGDEIGRNDAGFDPTAYLSQKFGELDEIRAALCDHERTSATSARAAQEVVDRISTVLQGKALPLPRTGISRFDREVGGGWQPSTLTVIAARTSMGKSIIGIEAADAMVRQGFGAVYHTLEMSRWQVSARQLSSRMERAGFRVPFGQILKGEVEVHHGERIAELAADMRGEPFWIEEAGGVTIGQIAATSERRVNSFIRQGVKPGAVIIDHAHKIEPSRRIGNAEGEIREVVSGALALAKRLELPVILLAQCNRQTEGREDKRPGPADLRGSGALEEDADLLVFPFRAAYYLERSPEYRAGDPARTSEFEAVKHRLELIIDKNRAGRSNVVVDAWIDPALNAVRDLSPYDHAEVRP